MQGNFGRSDKIMNGRREREALLRQRKGSQVRHKTSSTRTDYTFIVVWGDPVKDYRRCLIVLRSLLLIVITATVTQSFEDLSSERNLRS